MQGFQSRTGFNVSKSCRTETWYRNIYICIHIYFLPCDIILRLQPQLNIKQSGIFNDVDEQTEVWLLLDYWLQNMPSYTHLSSSDRSSERKHQWDSGHPLRSGMLPSSSPLEQRKPANIKVIVKVSFFCFLKADNWRSWSLLTIRCLTAGTFSFSMSYAIRKSNLGDVWSEPLDDFTRYM